jgi:hypothetical protein
MAHNTLISHGLSPAWALRTWQDRLPPSAPIVVVNNVLAGIGVMSPGTDGHFDGNARTLGRWLRAQTMLDFSLPADSSLRDKAAPLKGLAPLDLTPTSEFQLPIGTRALKAPPVWSPGAFQ